jgi:hypothetical protein
MLRCARVGGPGHCAALAAATARWRPRSSFGAAWRGEGTPAQGEVGPGVRGGATWVQGPYCKTIITFKVGLK